MTRWENHGVRDDADAVSMHAACLAIVGLEGVAVFFTQGVMHLACEDNFMRAFLTWATDVNVIRTYSLLNSAFHPLLLVWKLVRLLSHVHQWQPSLNATVS